eukprot:1136838-Pelagomonas_calceolata.AAC.8
MTNQRCKPGCVWSKGIIHHNPAAIAQYLPSNDDSATMTQALQGAKRSADCRALIAQHHLPSRKGRECYCSLRAAPWVPHLP